MKLFKVGAAVFALAVTSAAPHALQKPEPWALTLEVTGGSAA